MTATTETEVMLMQAVLEAPGDDGPRLVLADDLNEVGEHDKAAFIRYQILKPTRPPDGSYGCECNAPNARPPCSVCVDLTEEEWQESQDKESVRKAWDSEYLTAWYKCTDFESKEVAEVNGVKVKTTISRGFVDEIECTAAEWVGGPCDMRQLYGDNGGWPWHDGPDPKGCPTCGGSGRVEGIARQVCERWPVTRVRLTDKEPLSETTRFAWYSRVRSDRRNTIEEPLWDLLAGFIKYGDGNPFLLKWYPSRDAAQNALSLAAVNYGRDLAGLPPL